MAVSARAPLGRVGRHWLTGRVTRRTRVTRRAHGLAADVTAGLAGGLVAAWVMAQFQSVWSKLAERLAGRSRRQDAPQTSQHERSSWQEGNEGRATSASQQEAQQAQESGGEEEPATVQTATAIAQRVFHRELTQCQKQVAGPLVHYLYGALLGGAYGVLAERFPLTATGRGAGFGVAAWLFGDEVAVPLVILRKKPTEFPLSTHVYALASHVVYGVTLDAARRALRSTM